jgi:hypothetical protein
MKSLLFFIFILINGSILTAQSDSSRSTLWKPITRNYSVKHAIEIESLVPMFITGGYHVALGYRYKRIRIRASIINGGTYNAETAGINNSSDRYKRYYTTSPGIFLGYNVWRNLDVYSYLESHTFRITQRSSGLQQNLKSIDSGIGVSYQFFIGRVFYIQPGLHLYVRRKNSIHFGTDQYNIPTTDVSPVIRLGVRIWRKYM